MNPVVGTRLDAVAALCRRYGVERLELFGSANTSRFDPDRSDLDFLATYRPDADLGPWLVRFQEFQAELAHLFARRVDVVMADAVRDPIFKQELDRTRSVVFDATAVDQVA